MSYILDALRKSEHERQTASGQSVGMLYPIEIKHNRKPWLILTLLALTALITFTFIWWIWSRPIVTETSYTIDKPAITAVSRPKAISEEKLPEPIAKPEKPIPEYAQKKIRIPPLTDTRKIPPARAETPPSTTAVINKAVNADPLKELPALNITGYIHNEQSGSLAMINNQLVHEGEEISPGLRLIKILDNSAIFSYKGYVFSR